MKRRKIFAFLLSVALLLSISSGFAVGADVEKEELSTEAYAYMDLETASPEMQEKILKAREEIIFSQSWAADGCLGFLVDLKTGEMTQLPSFSELFPGWDLPIDDPDEEMEKTISIPDYIDPTAGVEVPEYAQEDLQGLPPLPAVEEPVQNGKFAQSEMNAANQSMRKVYSGSVYLRNPSDVVASTPFTTFRKSGIQVLTYADLLTTSETYNIGYRNVTTGEYLSYSTNIPYGYGFSLFNFNQFDCAVRASTYSTPGWSHIIVCNDLNDPIEV